MSSFKQKEEETSIGVRAAPLYRRTQVDHVSPFKYSGKHTYTKIAKNQAQISIPIEEIFLCMFSYIFSWDLKCLQSN